MAEASSLVKVVVAERALVCCVPENDGFGSDLLLDAVMKAVVEAVVVNESVTGGRSVLVRVNSSASVTLMPLRVAVTDLVGMPFETVDDLEEVRSELGSCVSEAVTVRRIDAD